MTHFTPRWLAVAVLFLSAVVAGVWTTSSAVLAQDPSPTPGYFVWLPLVLRDASITPTATPFPTPSATATATATPTVTPTSAPCSVSNVTGTYYAQITNMVSHGCPGGDPVAPAPGNIGVIQNGTVLTLRTVGGDAVGSINPATGSFSAQGPLPASAGCPSFATCTNTTTGAFTMGQEPMSFTGTGRIDVLVFGSPYCYLTYDTSGSRVSCAVPTTLSGDPWAPILRMLTNR